MRRVIFLVSAAVVLVSDAGCAKHYARRYAPAYYDAAPCGCDGAPAPIGGVVVSGPVVSGPVVSGPVGVSPQAVGAVSGPVISSTPMRAGAGY